MYETLLYRVDEGVATITLNRPDSLNSINRQMASDLCNALDRAGKNPGVRSLLLTGAGPGFCSGADLAGGVLQVDFEVYSVVKDLYNPIIISLNELEKPVIAAVNGVAAGGGCSLALACDLVIAAESSKFIQAFVGIGLVPDMGGSYFLPRLVGLKKAMELALMGEKISAPEAHNLGLINRVVPDNQLKAESNALAVRLARGPFSQGMIKTMFNNSLSRSLQECLEIEAVSQKRAAASEDCMEGISSFLQKKEAIFKGR